MQWRRSALGIFLVSIAVAIEALLLHGETRPMTHLQPEHPAHFFVFRSGPGADDECRTGKSLNAPMAEDAEEQRWERQTAVSGQTPWATGKLQKLDVFACDACTRSNRAQDQCNTVRR
jgi:hypothetical protein